MKKLKKIKLSKRIISVIIVGTMIIASMSVLGIKWLFDEFSASAAMTDDLTCDDTKKAYTINTYEDLVKYSQLYKEGSLSHYEYDVALGNLTGDINVLNNFVSIGTSENPFKNKIIVAQGSSINFSLKVPFFDYIYDTSSIVMADSATDQISNVTLSRSADGQGALFANNVLHNTNSDTFAQWSVTADFVRGENPQYNAFSGIIGTIESKAVVNLIINRAEYGDNNDGKNINISGSENVGLVCGTMKTGSSLSVTIQGNPDTTKSYDVKSTSNNAGGFVGEMESNSVLTINSDFNTSGTITATTKYAGGLVGKATDATVIFSGSETEKPTVTATVSGNSGTGGVFGYYETAENANITISNYKSTCTLNGEYNGGIFGELENKGTITIDSSNTVTASRTSSGSNNYGGLIGKYTSDITSRTLNVTGLTVNISKTGTASYYGGVIGRIDDDSYIKISDVTVNANDCNANVNTAFGGLVGYNNGGFIDIENNITIKTNGNFKGGGVVGNMNSGVLRLSGTTDLSETKTSSGGQIVGTREVQALIYAMSEWKLIRSAAVTFDDIGTWGEVLRFSDKLNESDVLDVDETNHTVTVRAATPSNISDINEFAKLALNIQMNNGATTNNTLNFQNTDNSKSSTLLSGTITITDDIDLSGTGITGLTRDTGYNDPFSGTLSGGNHTIILAIGEPYGSRKSGDTTTEITDTDTSEGNGKIYRHAYQGLFAKTGDNAKFENIKISGKVNLYDYNVGMYIGSLSGMHNSGSINIDNVTVNGTFNLRRTGTNYTITRCGGLIGQAKGDSTHNITINNSTVSPTITTNVVSGGYFYTGGAIGEIASTQENITINADTVTIGANLEDNSNSGNKKIGGFIAYIPNKNDTMNTRMMTLTNITIDGAMITAKNDTSSGGLLGESWNNIDVTIGAKDENTNSGKNGITVKNNSAVTNNGTGGFAGLVHTATGYWQVNHIDIQSLTVTGSNAAPSDSNKSAGSFGMLINKAKHTDNSRTYALYLELTNSNAYKIENSYVTLSGLNGGAVFDELVATCTGYYDESEVTVCDNNQAVVSIHTEDSSGIPTVIMDGTNCNTYQNQTSIKTFNKFTRYYYNLDVIRKHAEENSLSDPEKLMLWSVYTYAYSNTYSGIKQYFTQTTFPANTTTKGTYNMEGYSYYPVDVSSLTVKNADFKFYNKEIENGEKVTSGDNVPRTTDTKSQHYMMHCGLFRNVTGGVTATNVTFSGSVGNMSNVGSGALICGTLSGSPQYNANLTCNNISLNGITVSGITDDTIYAPLFINKIGSYSKLNIKNVKTPESKYSENAIAATSLIGDVGSNDADEIRLNFSGIVLDSRTTNLSDNEANTALDTAYNTKRSIFTNSTLLNKFTYQSGKNCSAVYNYKYEEDWGSQKHQVTYGKEISDSAEYPYNEGDDQRQKWYINNDEYYTSPVSANASSEYPFSSEFLPYVATGYNASTKTTHEIKINHKSSASLSEGCGTYNDPYIISNASQLELVANILGSDANVLNEGVIINYHSDNYKSWCNTDHKQYTYSDNSFVAGDNNTTKTVSEMQTALSTAYYKLKKDITLTDNFVGLGKKVYFKGVIDGGNYTITIPTAAPFIYSSVGSVIKDLNVDVKASSISLTSNSSTISKYLTDGDGNTPFYGGIIGIVNGGDNIIDNVGITFSNGTTISVTKTSYYKGNIAIGGYIGVVRYGGVIFRNMDSVENKTGLTTGICSDVGDIITNSVYLYQNPIIGRVIDGYAVTESDSYESREENVTMKNGTKNYSIADIKSTDGYKKLSIDANNTITVSDSQSLFLMGCIAMSGSGSASTSDGAYSSLSYTGTQMARHAQYDKIGTVTDNTDSDYKLSAEDKYSNTCIPYIIFKYTEKDTTDNYWARTLTKGTFSISLSKNAEYDLPDGFRGIGSLTTESIKMNIKDLTGNNATVKMNSKFSVYKLKSTSSKNDNYDNYYSINITNSTNTMPTKYKVGLGLFNCLDLTGTIQDLTLSGIVTVNVYTSEATKELVKNFNGAMCAGMLAGKCSNTSTTNPTTINNVSLKDATVSTVSISGGLIGVLSYQNINSIANLNRISADNLNVTAKRGAGGIIGSAANVKIICDGTKEDNTNTEFKINTIELNEKNDNTANVKNYYAGGLFGLLYNYAALTLKNMDIMPCSNDEDVGKIISYTYEALGGLIGTKYDTLNKPSTIEIEYCNVIDIDIKGGGQCAGVIAKPSQDDTNKQPPIMTISNTHVKRRDKQAPTISSYYGKSSGSKWADSAGIAGYCGGWTGSTITTLTIDNCSVEGYTMQSTNSEGCSGLVGKIETHNLVIKNSLVKDCILKGDGNIGGFLANNASGTGGFKGYNLVSDNVQIMNASGGQLADNYANAGDVVGNNNGKTLKLVGVSVQKQDNGIYATKAVGGTFTASNGYVIHSDYNGTCLGENPNKAVSEINNTSPVTDYGSYPYATINPKTDIDNILFLTGDGASKERTEQIKTDPEFDDYKDKISTFNTETGANVEKDFPVLVVNDSRNANVTNMINSYINILTKDKNITNYATDKEAVYNFKISSYRYDEETKTFANPESYEPNLSRDSTNGFGMTNKDYDSNYKQFTLLDIQYKDPINTSEIAYHLYIPVIVEKMLKFDFDSKILSGTTYKTADYTNNVAFESYGTPVTAYVKYSYQRTVKEWQDAINNNGENILQSYGKTIICKSNSDDNRHLNDNTKFVLVDKNNNCKAYYSTKGEAFTASDNKIDFSKFKSNDNEPFTAVSFYDLLSKSADIKAVQDDTNGTFVKCESEVGATVKTTDTKEYYRPKNDEDTGVTFYNITVNAKDGCIDSNGILRIEEDYYISFFTEENAENPMVNIGIDCAARLGDKGMTPSHLQNKKTSAMILGNLYTQTFSFSTENTDNIMKETNNCINANLSSKISINPEYKSSIQIYLTDNSIHSYHGFFINMTRTDENGSKTGVKGSPHISGTYKIGDNEYLINDTCDSAEIEITGKDENGTIVDISKFLKNVDSLEIKCDNLKITYSIEGIGEQFPEQPNDQTEYGVTLFAKSNMAYVPTNILYSNISEIEKDKNALVYYREKGVGVASLNYNIPTGTSDADAFSELGINGRELVGRINAVGYYDLSNIPEEELDKAKYVKINLSLFQKQNDKSYSPVDITDYLKDITLNGQSYNSETSEFTFDKNSLKNNIFKIPTAYTVKSGEEFENENKLYSNYKVLMSVQLLDYNKNPIANSSCDDYIVYTNAKIYTELIPRI